eukprot:TRINITY_DN31034_c0_g1_i1.p1 TRINITY_DN31034_c0_g1~~TRINITY_DN31034_c0_g1_i1.p1  ORF type:complete len:775 (-),score=99.04 TRINITY_DN31034_c0_g1_i1:251-2290(-)
MVASDFSTALVMDPYSRLRAPTSAQTAGLVEKLKTNKVTDFMCSTFMTSFILYHAVHFFVWYLAVPGPHVSAYSAPPMLALLVTVRCLCILWVSFSLGIHGKGSAMVNVPRFAATSFFIHADRPALHAALLHMAESRPAGLVFVTIFWAKLIAMIGAGLHLKTLKTDTYLSGEKMDNDSWVWVFLVCDVIYLLLSCPIPLVVSNHLLVSATIARLMNCAAMASSVVSIALQLDGATFGSAYLAQLMINGAAWFVQGVGYCSTTARTWRGLQHELPDDICTSEKLKRMYTRIKSVEFSDIQPSPRFADCGRPLRVLCIDGGGVKGLNAILIIQAFEKRLGCPVGEVFDLICGTSIGGCIAAACSVGLAGTQIEEMIDILRRDVMSKSSMLRLLTQKSRISGSLVDEYLQLFIKKYYGPAGGSTRLVHRPEDQEGMPRTPHFFCVNSQGDGDTWAPFVTSNYPRDGSFLNGANGWPLHDMLKATTAAPTFFPPCRPVADPMSSVEHVDGAICANNPSMVAIHEAQVLWPGRPIGCFVSLGTGEVESGVKTSAGGMLYWAGVMLSMAIEVNRIHKETEVTLSSYNGRGNACPSYFRINPTIPDVSIDESRKSVIDDMMTHVQGYITSEAHRIDRICAALALLSGEKLVTTQQVARIANDQEALRPGELGEIMAGFCDKCVSL